MPCSAARIPKHFEIQLSPVPHLYHRRRVCQGSKSCQLPSVPLYTRPVIKHVPCPYVRVPNHTSCHHVPCKSQGQRPHLYPLSVWVFSVCNKTSDLECLPPPPGSLGAPCMPCPTARVPNHFQSQLSYGPHVCHSVYARVPNHFSCPLYIIRPSNVLLTLSVYVYTHAYAFEIWGAHL